MVINAGKENEVTVRVVLESDVFGREYFDSYDTMDEVVAAVKRLGESAAKETAKDGLERVVAIAIVPPSLYGDESGYGYGLEPEIEDED